MRIEDIFPVENWDFNTSSIFTNLPLEDRQHLMGNALTEKYKKGDTIFREGALPFGIFYIEKGKVKKYKIDNFGKEHIFYVANTGEFIGYHAVLSSERYPDSATALEESMISFISKETFLDALERSPLLSRKLLKILSHEFSVLTNKISISNHRPVRERLAITLIELREKFKAETMEGTPIMINLSREDIANMAGTTRENTVRLLRDFKNEKLIETKGRKIWITDLEKLAAVSQYK